MGHPRHRDRTGHGSALADQFVARRHRLSLTQDEVADLAAVSRSSVHALESGRATVRMDVVTAVAEALGCEVSLVTKAGDLVA